MTADELRQLPPAQAMQVAAQDLSLPDNFFDRQWAQESSRGQNMVSPVGARGHFGIMPKTQAAWEKRDGAAYNPDDFYDGLYLAHATMQENLARFKNPVDATRAYNSGWDPALWNNPETNGYIKALWGDSALPSLKQGPAPTSLLPSLKAGRPEVQKGNGAYDQIGTALLDSFTAGGDTIDATREQSAATQADLAAEQTRKDATGFNEVAEQALRDPRIMPTWSIMRRFQDGANAPDPSWDYMDHRDELEKGATDEEREYLRENAVSADSAQRAQAELYYRRSVDSTYADAGSYSRFTGQMAAGLADPASLLAGAAAGKAFQVARIGLSPWGRVGALAAENATANVAIEGLSDAMGEHKTSGDYAMAAASSLLFTAPFARGVYRSGVEAETHALARGMQEQAVSQQAEQVAKTRMDDPSLPTEAIGPKVAADEANTIRTAVDETVAPQRLDRVIPEDVGKEMVDEFTGVQPEEPAPAAKDTSTAAVDETPRPAEPPADVVQQIRDEGTVTRKATDTATGHEVKLTWSAEGNKQRGHGNVGEALDAVIAHPNVTADQQALATYMQKVLAKDALDVEVHVAARDARSSFDPNGPQVKINRPDVTAAGETLAEKINGLSPYGLEVILHEAMHAATYHRINAWEKAAGKLTRDQQRLMGQYQDLFDRFQEHLNQTQSESRRVKYAQQGANYAAKDLHEFAAQFFTDKETRLALDSMPGKALAGRTTSALREMLGLVRKTLGFTKRNSAFEEGSRIIDQIIAMPLDNVRYADGKPVFSAPHVSPPVTETAEFKRWFGKSRVVDPRTHEPLLMYHGTNKTQDGEAFKMFDTYSSDHGLFGQGGYFTADASVASSYTKKGRGDAPTVYPVYLNIEHPIDMDAKAARQTWANAFPDVEFSDGIRTNEFFYREVEEHFRDLQYEKYEAAEAIQDGLRKMGDGITHMGGGRVNGADVRHRVYIAFDPEQIKSATGNNGEFNPDNPSILNAPKQGADVSPRATQRARDTWAERMTQYAQGYLQRNPINVERLNTLTMKVGGASDGLILANSKNPIMQLVASLVTETTTGAAGRKANVAIRAHLLTRKFVGDTMMHFENSYTVWRNRNGGSVAEDVFKGDTRRKFDKKVYEEVVARRGGNYAPSPDRAVNEAADALESLFERSRVAQVDAGVLGHGALPSSSRGYIPQALDGVKLQAATAADLSLLHDALARQFQDRLGWDEQFARSFAPFYTERARRRAMGDKGLEGLGAGGEGLQLVRDTLDEMGQDPNMVDRARAAQSKLGQSHTKTRLDLDLLQELRPGLRMMDFFNTNPLLLARSYAKRTAGTVALTDAGIHGVRGVRELEQASLWKGHPVEQQPSAKELEAFRRVASEILGTPVATSVVSNGASNLQLLVSLQRLGGLVFTQAAETFNMIQHLGLRSLLSGVGDLPRMMGEIGRLKKGAASGNHILTSIEQYGGELGTESYKMIAPLDAPDRELAVYMDHQPGLFTRALRAGGHLQSKLSGFRGLMAAQHRMVAEQIVMKAARFIRDGGDDVALRDMGFTPDVAAAMKGDLSHIAKWDANDKLMEFDLTRVSDARVAEAFVQAVHRGTSQIIQGTFIGERTKWMHNDYMKLLLQLRSFGLTSTEKQWGRTRMNHGYAYAAGVLLGQMALVLPIHFARLQLAAMGMPEEQRAKFLKDNLRPFALTKASMNYASMSGSTSDVLDILTGIAGGWGDKDTQEMLGARSGLQSASIGKLVPAAGSVDTLARVVGGRTDLHTAMKQLPFSNLWYLLPALNLTKH